jgi:sulfhydrogenase subunit beta (sulfur reductase)
MSAHQSDGAAVIDRNGLQALIDQLAAEGYRVIGPLRRDDAIVYDEITGIADLPEGWTDRQDGGRYRLERRSDDALFGYNVGPHSWKQFLHPPREVLWNAAVVNGEMSFAVPDEALPKFAFVGVRACEIAAIEIQDKVFRGGPYLDTSYEKRRNRNFIVAVNCGQAGNTCFCASMHTGPRAEGGFDLALTELVTNNSHEFLAETGSRRGAEVLSKVSHRPAKKEHFVRAKKATDSAASQMGRKLETDGLKELLQANPNHPRWDNVAERCLTCGNCTMVCPTCFCTTVEDHCDLEGNSASHIRKWDSCFTMDFSYIHGGSVRNSAKSRYRQWMTHKLASWFDQFGTLGCVGCGRCITWCPVGIDITEEANAIRASVSETEHGNERP